MDFAWSREQLAFKNAVIEFAQEKLNDQLIERDWQSEFARDNWRKCAELGIQGLPIPERYGGAGADVLTTVLALEGLGYGCRDMGLLFSLNAHIWAVQMPILKFGTEEQKQKYLPGICSGQIIGAHCMTEPDAGSDAFSLRTRARRVSDGYVLNGTKTFVTNGSVADFALVFATLDPAKQRWGISAFLVDKATPGFAVSDNIRKMGLRTSPMNELVLDCLVPVDSRLGPEGAGASIFTNTMSWERGCSLASHVGAMQRQLEQCIKYASERRQFNQPIGKYQSVANRIADMKVRLETARLLLYRAAWLLDKGEPAATEASIAKLFLSESYIQSSLDALRIHGGWGYTTEFEVERNLRDAIGATFYAGTSDIQRLLIANYLGL